MDIIILSGYNTIKSMDLLFADIDDINDDHSIDSSSSNFNIIDINEIELALLNRNKEYINICTEKLVSNNFSIKYHSTVYSIYDLPSTIVSLINEVISNLKEILAGNYVNVINNNNISDKLTISNLFNIIKNEVDPSSSIQDIVLNYISTNSTNENEPIEKLSNYLSGFYLLSLSQAYYEIFLQMNYTGPEISPTVLIPLIDDSVTSKAFNLLECDGYYTYPLLELPQVLFISRVILSTLSFPNNYTWRFGIVLDSNGTINRPIRLNDQKALEISQYTSWFSARAIVIHLRTLQQQNYSHIPTLMKESNDSFDITIDKYSNTFINRELLAQLWLEKGLSQHHFQYKDKGKEYFVKAQKIAGLTVEMSGALGRRTKYQQFDIAQLYLQTSSQLINQKSNYNNNINKSNQISKQYELVTKENDEPVDPNAWQHSEWQLGRRLVGEVKGSNETAAVREVMLDSIDGGPPENILYEKIKFTNENEIIANRLHPVDQSIILALCLDVNNSNPQDGLTSEEMFPYIQRVLDEPINWMIHSTGLLERSWLEYERQKTFDRALLQIQALLDQHTTKLTITQSTMKSIEESAQVDERLQYIHSLVYPAQFELKKDLAERYLRSQVFASALNLFKELNLWDEVVKCYQLLDKPQRAEIVVREQLKINETPYMLTALADLTSNESLYEKAWILSNRRYARAKRTLARISYDRGDYFACVEHLDAALKVQPLVAHSWYLRGIASMHLEDWSKGLESFLRCIQQDMEIAEAHANMGSIHMKLRDFMKAYISFNEAIKHQSDNWKIRENLMLASLALNKFKDVIIQMEQLLNLRNKSNRPVHLQELRYLVDVITSDQKQSTSLIKSLETLLLKISNTITNNHEIFDIIANFYFKLNNYRKVIEYRVKEFRSIISSPNWEKDLKSIKNVTDSSNRLLIAHQNTEATKSDIYSCKSLLQTTLKKLELERSIISSVDINTRNAVEDVDSQINILKLNLQEIDKIE